MLDLLRIFLSTGLARRVDVSGMGLKVRFLKRVRGECMELGLDTNLELTRNATFSESVRHYGSGD